MSKHSRERARERYNIQFSKGDEEKIINKIHKGNFLYISSPENKKHFVYVLHNNIPLKILYHKSTNDVITIITTYPFDVDEYNKLLQEDFNKKIEYSITFLKNNGYIIYKKKTIQTT